MSYDQLRTAVKEACEVILSEELADLVRKMRGRCQAMIDAQGG
jgi:hypothetical protein